jgi:chromosomal replication initiation ATPase DnaA
MKARIFFDSKEPALIRASEYKLIAPVDVLRIVCKSRNTNLHTIKEQSRRVDLAMSRFIIWHFLSTKGRMGPTNIARAFNRNHSTVIKGLQRFYGLVNTDEDLREEVAEIKILLEQYQS